MAARLAPVNATGREAEVDLSGVLPADAVGVIASLAVTDVEAPGFFTMSPAGQYPGSPSTSTLNVAHAWDTVTNQVEVLVAVSPDRGVDLWANVAGDAVIDVVGKITGPTSPASTDGVFVALPSQQRLADITHTGLNQSTSVEVATGGGIPVTPHRYERPTQRLNDRPAPCTR